MSGALLLVATPLGNLGDVTLRALEALRGASAIICEDTRHSQRFLGSYDIHKPLLSMPAFDENRRTESLVARLVAGERLALISDAGSVCISDPGERLVAAALEAGIAVEVFPGPSAAVAALQISGLPTRRFAFVGFLPRKGEARHRMLAELAGLRFTLVIYESPRRVGATLAELVSAWGDRRATVVRELTKLHEEVRRGRLSELAARFSGEVLGEVTLVVEGAEETAEAPDESQVLASIERHTTKGLGTRAVAKAVAIELGLPVREIYQRLIAAKPSKG
jgi:16S rRNA (cytidine1402-2'-O)-methyltransferase